MLSDLILTVFAVATGFVGAGILSSAYQLVTTEPARFDVRDDRITAAVAYIVFLMFSGPAILMRNAIRGRIIESRPWGWLFASTMIAGGWSLCSGVVLLDFILSLGAAIS